MEYQILLVTSQPQILAPISAVLKSILGHGSTFIDPEDAIRVIANNQQDMVIIDMHNRAVCMSLIRNIKVKFPTVPVIAMVPYGDVMMVEQAINQGADDYISQPIALERLKVTLRNILRLRSLLLRAYSHVASHPAGFDHDNGASLLFDSRGSLNSLQVIEDKAIENAVEFCGGCITQAARMLGIGRSTLYRKLQDMQGRQPQTLRANQTTRPTTLDSSIDVS